MWKNEILTTFCFSAAPDKRTSAVYYFLAAIFVLLIAFDTLFALPLLVSVEKCYILVSSLPINCLHAVRLFWHLPYELNTIKQHFLFQPFFKYHNKKAQTQREAQAVSENQNAACSHLWVYWEVLKKARHALFNVLVDTFKMCSWRFFPGSLANLRKILFFVKFYDFFLS